jgi:hypothetical protein
LESTISRCCCNLKEQVRRQAKSQPVCKTVRFYAWQNLGQLAVGGHHGGEACELDGAFFVPLPKEASKVLQHKEFAVWTGGLTPREGGKNLLDHGNPFQHSGVFEAIE